jgi:uncharacterized protein YegL
MRTLAAFILDKSDSMTPLQKQAIDGFNEWKSAVVQDAPDALLTLTLFDTRFTTPIVNVPITEVADLDETRYVPSGMTALYDAIGVAIKALDAEATDDDRVLVNIFTDGQENSSREMTKATIAAMVADREAKGNWTFTYLSASPSAFADAQSIGIAWGNTQSFDPTQDGTAEAFAAVAGSTTTYLRSGDRQARGFYGDPDEITSVGAKTRIPGVVMPDVKTVPDFRANLPKTPNRTSWRQAPQAKKELEQTPWALTSV